MNSYVSKSVVAAECGTRNGAFLDHSEQRASGHGWRVRVAQKIAMCCGWWWRERNGVVLRWESC